MQFKLARLRLTKTEKQAIRDHNWTRAYAIINLNYPQEIDLWWCEKFLLGIISQPLVVRLRFGRETVTDETNEAKYCLNMLEQTKLRPRTKPIPIFKPRRKRRRKARTQ